MPPIEAVLVDVGGVLVLPDHDRMVGAFERAGVRVDRDRLDRAHYAGVAALTEFKEGDREVWAAYNRAYARSCDTPADALDDVVEHLLNEFATGEVWSPELHAKYPGRDWMLTRLLWLSGRQPGFNRLGDVDTMRRYIYIHGSPDTAEMGRPGSIGCIRMRNRDIVELFERVPPYAPVEIRE